MHQVCDKDLAVLRPLQVVSLACEPREDVPGVGQVEVSCQEQGAFAPEAVVHHGVACVKGPSSEGAVAQMAEVDVPAEGPLQRREGAMVTRGDGVAEHSRDALQQVRQRHRGAALLQLVEGASRRHVQPQARDSRAVLAPVVLLLQQQGELFEAVCGRAVLRGVVRKGLSKAQQGYAAFVFDAVGQGAPPRKWVVSGRFSTIRIRRGLMMDRLRIRCRPWWDSSR